MMLIGNTNTLISFITLIFKLKNSEKTIRDCCIEINKIIILEILDYVTMNGVLSEQFDTLVTVLVHLAIHLVQKTH